MPSKKKKMAKGRQDKYYQMAKEQGYRARSAFKLIQLNKKYNFLSTSKAVLDLCAAPGGWCQVAAKHCPVSSLIIGIDLVPIKPIHNVKAIQGDITTDKARADIRKALNKWKVDVVLHDGSPNVGTSWAQDAYSQSELVLHSLRLACDFLMKDGWFITKVFRSNEYNALLWVFQQLFRKVEATKPSASRNASAEIYVVCQGYLDPKKIDPKLMDPKHVFGDLDAPAKNQDVFHKKLGKRPSRIGYEEGSTSLYKAAPARAFVETKDPIPMLAEYSAFTFDGDSAMFKTHRATTDEILTLCEDLKVLGKGDFKRLLRWRLVMSQFKAEQEGDTKADVKEVEPELTPEQKEQALSDELDARIKKLSTKKSKVARKEAERRAKLQRRIDAKMHLPGDQLDIGAQEDGLFSLNAVRGDSALHTVMDADAPSDVDDDETERPAGSDDESVDSADEEDYSRKVEEYLDRAYEDYQERKGKRAQQSGEGEGIDDLHTEMWETPASRLRRKIPGFEPKVSGNPLESDDDEDDDEDVDTDQPANSLIVSDDAEAVSMSKRAALFFGNSLFDNIKEDELEDAEIQEQKAKLLGKVKPEAASSDATPAAAKIESDEAEEEPVLLGPYFKGGAPADKKKRKGQEADDDSEDERTRKKNKGAEAGSRAEPRQSRKQQLKERKRKRGGEDGDEELEEEAGEQEGFEEVPMAHDYLADMDDEQRATALAIGSLMVNHKKLKQEIIDSAYNRYAFNDPGLPRWFTDEEGKHNQPTLPVTKEEVNEQKRRMREINARPIKKVAEAKARKKMKAAKRMESVKAQANAIANNAQMKPGEKMQAIARLKKKAKVGKRPERTLVVSRKSGGTSEQMKRGKGAGKVRRVDPRMKKEVRASQRRSGSGGGKRGKGGRR